MAQRERMASVNLGSSRAIGCRLMVQGVVDKLAILAEEGMASEIDEGFDIDAFVDAVKPGA